MSPWLQPLAAQLVCHTKRANGKQTTILLPVITLPIQPSGSGDLAAISSHTPNISAAAAQFLFFYNQSCTPYQRLHCYYEVSAETEGLWKSNVSQTKQFWSADFTAKDSSGGAHQHTSITWIMKSFQCPCTVISQTLTSASFIHGSVTCWS